MFQYISFSLLRTISMVLATSVVASSLCLAGEISPHGLEPADDMPFIPDLEGLRAKPFKNQSGQTRQLSEGVVVRRSNVADGAAVVPAGGLYYLSEVKDEVRPLQRDPFLVMGEHAYLVGMKSSRRVIKNVSIKKGEKIIVDQDGYRLWFDYATDHYDKPYLQLALISPAGHWPTEFPVSTKFPSMQGARNQNLPHASAEAGTSMDVPQLDDFFMDQEFVWGASRFVADKTEYGNAHFSSLEYPVIDEATFSMSRPWVMDLRQEDFRWYKDKRIYAFRRPEGFLIRVTNATGSTVLGEKIVSPITPQTYKDSPAEIDKYGLTLEDQDMRVEIVIEPEYQKNSDFMPWTTDAPNGWTEGVLSLAVYSDLVKVRRGEPWALDARYSVGLEANLMTGGLQRLVLENRQPFRLNKENDSFTGPIKWSHVWNRPAFKLVAGELEGSKVGKYYLRDSFFQRTDNMVFDKKSRRSNIDFFVGRTPTFVSILEDTFLTRLADSTYSTVVQGSHFTSFPNKLSNMAFCAPDPTAPFQARMRGFERKIWNNTVNEKITGAEGMVIRGSYVDWRNNRVVIPPSGLYYTSRNARNVRAMRDEPFFLFGTPVYLVNFESVATVRRNFTVDFWKLQPTGEMNSVFWQDIPVGEQNKMLRYSQRFRLDDRPVSVLNIVKYSGNNFGAPFITSTGLSPENNHGRYALHSMYAEGATWISPDFIGENSLHIAEFGTPSIHSFSYSETKPLRKMLGAGDQVTVDGVMLTIAGIDEAKGTVTLIAEKGSVRQEQVLGPLNAETRKLLPQHQRIVHSLQYNFDGKSGRNMVEMDPQSTFADSKVALRLITNVREMNRNTPLPWDNRFVIRPDVCGHCYQLNELLVDNAEPIVLDKDHPRFEGPHGPDGVPLFTIVLDHFDGEMVQGWHIETHVRNRVFKSENLAFFPRNNVDCLIGVNGTVEGFLRATMLERSAYQEYWRVGHSHPSLLTGRAQWLAHLFQ